MAVEMGVRVLYGAGSLVAGAAIAYTAYRNYRVIAQIGEALKNHNPQCPNHGWLKVARICAIIGTIFLTGYGLFHVACFAKVAVAGTYTYFSQTTALVLDISFLVGIGCSLFAAFLHFIGQSHGHGSCPTPPNAQRGGIRTLREGPPSQPTPRPPVDWSSLGRGYRLGET